MWCRLYLVCFLAITLVNSYVSENYSDQLVSYKEAEILKGVFNQLKTLIENSIHFAQMTFKRLRETLREKAAGSIEDLRHQLEREVEKIMTVVQTLEEKAKEDRIDIKDCLKDRKETITNYSHNVGKEISKFEKEKLKAGMILINDGSGEVLRVTKRVDVLTEEHTKCARMFWLKRAICYTKVNVQMTKEYVSISLSLHIYKKRASQYVKHISTDINAYGQDKIQQARNEGEALITEMKKCIESKRKPKYMN